MFGTQCVLVTLRSSSLLFFNNRVERKYLMKKMLVLFFAFGLAVTLISSAMAFEVQSQPIDVKTGTTFVSKYLFRGVDTFLDDDPGVQPYATVVVHPPLDLNLSVGFWGSYALSGGHENVDEQDYWFSLDRDILDGYVNVFTGYTYYDFFNADTVGDINEWNMGGTLKRIPIPGTVNLPLFGTVEDLPISVGYYAAYGWGNDDPNSGGINPGWFQSVTAGIDIPIPGTNKIPGQGDDGLALSYKQIFGFYDGYLNFSSGFAYFTQSWGTAISLPFNFTVSPTFNYQVTDQAMFPAAVGGEDEFYFTVDIATAI